MAKKGRPSLKRARTSEGKYVGDDPTTLENEAWKKPKGKTLWDIIVELKGTVRRKPFFEWLIKG